jgi:hypothetical protein
MAITITPTSPIVQSFTTTKTYVSVKVVDVDYDINENKITNYIELTTDAGIVESDTVEITGDAATTLLATAATAGQTLGSLVVQAVIAAVQTKLSFTVASVS